MPLIVQRDPKTGEFPPPVTTMMALDRWTIVPAVDVATFSGPGGPQPVKIVDAERGVPVRIYVCRICGYVEMYAGAVVAPEQWSGPGGHV